VADLGVKSYIELNSWASQSSKRLRGYAAWLLARHLDQRGAGCCSQVELIDFCHQEKLWSDATTRRYIEAAIDQGLLRLGRDKRLTYISLKKLQEREDVRCSRLPVLIPLCWFRGKGKGERLGKLRRGFLLAFLGEGRTIANATLADMFGAKQRTIKSWTKKLEESKELKKQENAVALPLDLAMNSADFRARFKDEDQAFYQIPNTLRPTKPFEIAPSGVLNWRARNACSQTRPRNAERRSQAPTERGTKKLYYPIERGESWEAKKRAAKAAEKARRLLGEGEHLFERRPGDRVEYRRRIKHGLRKVIEVQLWTRWERKGGVLCAC